MYLSKYLRHAPSEFGLVLQPGGRVPVDDLLAAAEKNSFPITYDELVSRRTWRRHARSEPDRASR
jgi:putative RNA 2'-phosphotransferase